MTETISLEKYEQYVAACVGVRRRIASWDYHDNQSPDKDGWIIDIEGACAEMASAKYFDLYWDGSVNTFKNPDLKPDIQIRNTPYDYGKLIIRPKDNKEERFVLVCGRFPEYTIAGWIYGYEGQKDEYWDNPNNKKPAWLVPQDVLRPIKELKEMLAKAKYDSLFKPRPQQLKLI